MSETIEHSIAPEAEAPAKAQRETLWVTDEELIRRLGAPRRATRAALHMFDSDMSKGFPAKQALWGNTRYWPAVKAYFDIVYGLKIGASQQRRQP